MFLVLLMAPTVKSGLEFCESYYEAYAYYYDWSWLPSVDYGFSIDDNSLEDGLLYYYYGDGTGAIPSNSSSSMTHENGGYYEDDDNDGESYGRRLEDTYYGYAECGVYDDGRSATCNGTVVEDIACTNGTLLKVADGYGDGWNGACWSISPGGYGGGISCTDCEEPCCSVNYTLCLDADVEYEFSVGGEDQRGSWDDEIVWQLGSWTGTGATDKTFTIDMLEYAITAAPTSYIGTVVTSVVMNLSTSGSVFYTHTFDTSSASSELAEITGAEALIEPGGSNISFDFTFYLFNGDTLIDRETATGGLLVLLAKTLSSRELPRAVQPYVTGSTTTSFDKAVGVLSGSQLGFSGGPCHQSLWCSTTVVE